MTDRVRQAQIKRLELQLKKPENKECFDCTSKQPRWASTNLGIFFCLNCSGVHRSLGTHISKVKSATMDTWEEEMMQCVERIGNLRGKQLYEAEGWKGGKLDVNCSGAERERNCRRKYEQRAYYAKNHDELYEQFLATPPTAAGASDSPAISLAPATSVTDATSARPTQLLATAPPSTAPVNTGQSLDWGDFGSSTGSPAVPAQPQQGATSNNNSIDSLFQSSTSKPTTPHIAAGDFGIFQSATPPTTSPVATNNNVQVGTVGGCDSLMSFKPATVSSSPPPPATVGKVQTTQQTNDILAAFGGSTGPRFQQGRARVCVQGPPPIQQPQGNIFAVPQPQQHQFQQQQSYQQKPQPVWATQQNNNGGFF